MVGKIIHSVIKASFLPVSVKMRLGWDQEHINATKIAKIGEEEGASFVTIHGRTTSQQYSGHADWQVIAHVKQNVGIPVIANGDITDAASAAEALRITSADGLAIGRASLGNPWVFKEICSGIQGVTYRTSLPEERLLMAEKHARYLRASLPEHRALLEMRKFYAWYIKGLRGAAEARSSINTASSFDQINVILQKLIIENKL